MVKQIKYEAFLKLETGTHTARVNQLLVTPDDKTLITAGGDKTIRVWDIETKKQTGMLLGQIGAGSDGKIQAISISRDGKYVVALVWLNPEGTHEDHERDTDVRVYELSTGNLQAAFRYPGTLQDLDFSPSGGYLAIVGNPKGAIRRGHVLIYDTKKIMQGFGKVPSPVASDVLYDNDTLIPSYVRFVPEKTVKSTVYRIVVATWNHNKGEDTEYTGRLLWYSYSSSKGMEKIRERETEGRYAPDSLTVSSEFVIITGDLKKFFGYDHEGKLVAEVISESKPAQPTFSKDESQLIVGQRGDSALVQVKVYNISFGQFQLKSTYYGHDSDTVAVALLQDGTAVSAGGDQNAIHFWNPVYLEGEQIAVIRGVGRVVHAVGVNQNDQIGIGNHDDLRLEDGNISLQRKFDLRSMTFKPLTLLDLAEFQRSQMTFGEQRLEWMEQWGNTNLFLQPDNMPFTGVHPVGWYFPTTFGFTEKGTVITGAGDGKIRVASRKPDGSYQPPERVLIGHAARVLDHAANSKWLVTAGADQIIRVWHLEDVDQDVMTDLEPALNLFIGADDEWVVWSKSGYYNASQRGDRRFGYHVNRGMDKEALFFSSDRFIKSFFRPDIIQAIVEHGSEEKALVKLAEQGLTSAKINVSEILPPIVELTKNGIVATKNEVTFTFTVESLNSNKPVARVWIVQNEQFVWESQKLKSTYKVVLPLQPGRNRFKILAENENAKSTPLIQVIFGPDIPTRKTKKSGTPLTLGKVTARGAVEAARSQSNTILSDQDTSVPDNGILYLLAVGVSTLQNETADFKSLKYADIDAISIYNAFARSKLGGALDKKAALKNKAFKSVESVILRNEEATKSSILKAVDSIGEKIRKRSKKGGTQRDVFFVFLSGHGVRRSDEFERELYFWNYDLDKSHTRATGLSFIELGKKITSLPADIIIATDACHSGMAGSDMVRGLDPNELAKHIYAINERGIYILNAARSEELALESGREDIQHGIFTKSILETLELGGDVSMINLISSVQERVQHYTQRTQTPVCRMYGDLLPLVVYKK